MTPSPPKPWERVNGATGGGGAMPVTTAPPTTVPVPTASATTSSSALMAGQGSGEIPPAVPARPTSMSSGYGTAAGSSTYGNRTYNLYGGGTGYSSGYSPYGNYGSYGNYGNYGSYSPYNRYGSTYSSYSPYNRYGGYGGGYGTYGTPYGRFGTYGGGMMGGPGVPEELSLTQRMEASTAAGFHLMESVVNAFGGFAQMLDSTFFATHSSFMAMVGLVEHFGNLRNYLGQILSVFAIVRWARKLYYKLTGKQPSVNPTDLNAASFQQFEERQASRRPMLLFFLAVFGIPYLMHKLIQIISSRQREQIAPSAPVSEDSNVVPAGDVVPPQNLEFCRAIYDFRGETPVELSFRRGDIIAILSKTDVWGQPSQWWRGRLRSGEQGVFPANYVEIINKGVGNLDAKDAAPVKGTLPSANVMDGSIDVDEFARKIKVQ